MNDVISRQAAVEAIENTDWYHLRDGVMVHGANSKEHQAWYKEQDIYKALEQLPSAQPDSKETSPTHKALDTISRQAAIDALDKRFDSIPMEQTTEILLLRKDLRELPSAQPEVLACGEGELTAQTTGAPLHDNGSDYAHGFADGYKQGLKDAESERVRCKDCLYWVAHDKRCVYLNHGFAPNMWCCHGRRADG